jgi:hypothetical protein
MAESQTFQELFTKVTNTLPHIATLFQNPDVVASYQSGAFMLTKVLRFSVDYNIINSQIRPLFNKLKLFMTKLDPAMATPELYLYFGDCNLALKFPEQALKEYDKAEALVDDYTKAKIYTKKGDIASR